MRILIVGATGLVGQGVLLATHGHPGIASVALLSRSPVPNAPPQARLMRVEDFSSARLQALDLAGLDACIYCAGIAPLGVGERTYRDATVDMTLRVVTAYAAANPAGRFVYVSGAGANPDSRSMPMRVKGQAESALNQLSVSCVCVRPGVVRPVMGCASPHAFRRLVYRLADPLLRVGSAMAPKLFTDSASLSAALLAVATMEHPPGVVENSMIEGLMNVTRQP
ncbi:MAG: oxidoreductase [Sphingobacteriales bacterium]|nr:MAG: oxidoreductase [Sphingobacteriales bacterium]